MFLSGDSPPILFAHRGARAHAPENTLEAFRLGLKLGATGLESDLWMTSDGVAVLDHDGWASRLRRRRIDSVDAADLSSHIPRFSELLDLVPPGTQISIDLKDSSQPEVVLEEIDRSGMASSVWLCHHDLSELGKIREQHSEVRLVHSTDPSRIDGGLERHIANLRSTGVDCLNMRESVWKAGDVALCHRFGRCAFGWDAQHHRTIRRLLTMGIDGIFSDHVDRLTDALNEFVQR